MRIGEIVETRSTGFVAESLQLNQPPPLGSLVKVEWPQGVSIYGVVAYGESLGLEPGRRAVRRGTDEVYDAAVYAENPQLPHIIRTVFHVLFAGWDDGTRLRQQLPPQPPPLHYSVHTCEVGEVERFTDSDRGLYYLRLLLSADVEVPVVSLVVAHINQTYLVRGEDRAWLEAAARELASLLKRDHDSLMGVLYGIDPERGAPSLGTGV